VGERRIVARVRADARRAHAEIVPASDPTGSRVLDGRLLLACDFDLISG